VNETIVANDDGEEEKLIVSTTKTIRGSTISVAIVDFMSDFSLRCTARVFSRDSPGKVAQWTGKPIRES
jgi:hypothetical protein